MLNYKYMLLAGGLGLVIPASVSADTCSTLPSCTDIGFTYTSAQCGNLKKLKCPFGEAYFCSGNNCNSVSVGTYEVCTKYCAEDKNVCIEKRAATCSEYVSKLKGTLKQDGSTISGTITSNLYLLGTVTSTDNNLKFTQMSVYDGADIPACKEEMNGKTGYLKVNRLKIENYAYFNVKTDINSINYDPSGSNGWSANFSKDTTIKINMTASNNWVNTLNLYFSGEHDYINGTTKKTTNLVEATCASYGDGSQWNPARCYLSIDSDKADVTLCKRTTSTYTEIDAMCDGYNEDGSRAECKEGTMECSWW